MLKLRFGLLCLMSLFVLLVAACQQQEEPEPLVIYITATPLGTVAQPTQAPAMPSATPQPPTETTTPFPTLTRLASFPTATLTATIEGVPSATPYLSPTPTNSPQAFPTATFTSTVEGVPSSTPFPTFTPGGDVPPPPISEGNLPSFPTATPTATLEGQPSPTTQPIIAAPTSAGLGTLPATEVANVVPPPAISNLAPPPDQLPILYADHIGIQIHPFVTNEEWANALGLTNQLGMGWIKFQLPWDVAEPSPGEFSFQYQRLVLLVQQAHIQGFKVLISVNRAPNWARPSGADPALHGPPADPQSLADFISRLVKDIKPEFMEAIEIWNEPNLRREWDGAAMDGATYMRYFGPAYEAAKAVDPSVIVVTAGLAPVGEVDGAADDRSFLAQIYAAGLSRYPDVRIGVHPYAWANPPDARCCTTEPWADAPQFFMLDTIEAYRQIMLDNGDSSREMWVTEFGWGTYEGITSDGSPASPPEVAAFFNDITLKEQAEYTLRAFEILQAPPYSEYVEVIFLWNMNFATVENAITDRMEQAGYSLLNAAGRPRLLFYYLLNTRRVYDD